MLFAVFILGACTVLGFAPFQLCFLPIVTLGLLFLSWRSHSRGPWYSFRLGFSFGLGFFLGGIHWVYTSLHTFGGVPAVVAGLITLLFSGYLALYPALTGFLTHYLTSRSSNPRTLWFTLPTILWTVTEWLRGWLFTGFPWLRLGATQVGESPLANVAPIGGELLISFVVVGLASILASFLANWQTMSYRQRCVPITRLVLILVATTLLGKTSWVSPLGEPLKVSLLQGNIPQDAKWDETHIESTLNRYAQLVREAQGQLIIFPETALPLFLHQLPLDYWKTLERLSGEKGAELLIGIPEKRRLPPASDKADSASYYNSVITLGQKPMQVYRKQHLVPLGEYIPLRFILDFILRFLEIPLLDFSPGPTHPQPLSFADQYLAVSICYEDAFGNEVIRQLPQATLLVNVSNDAWFGSTIAPWQHLQLAQLRALETGRMMVRANNTGITAIIDQRGKIVGRLPSFATSVLEGSVQGFSGTTPYVRWGNRLVVGLLGIVSGLLLVLTIRHRRPEGT